MTAGSPFASGLSGPGTLVVNAMRELPDDHVKTSPVEGSG